MQFVLQKCMGLLRLEEQENADKFWFLKADWIEKQEELGEALIDVENRRLENENLKVKWMKIFGGEYIALEEANHRLLKAQNLRDLKRVNPDMKKDELE